MKRFCFTAIAICLLLVSISLLSHKASASTSETVASGSCGDNVNWILSSNGELSIWGEGDMYDYSGYFENPWTSYRNSINRIYIGDGITSIGDYSFPDFSSVTSVSIPSTVTEIGNSAFYFDYNLEEISIPANIKYIGNYSFAYCAKLTEIIIPGSNSVCIGDAAFLDCTELKSLIIQAKASSIGRSIVDGCNNLNVIFYFGIEEDRSKIDIAPENDILNSVQWHYPKSFHFPYGRTALLCSKCGLWVFSNGSTVPLKELIIDTPPEQLNYVVNDTINLNGISLKGTYNDYFDEVNISKEAIEEISADLSTPGRKTASISIGGVSAEFDIYVHDSVGAITLDSSLYPQSSHNYTSNLNETKTFTYPGALSLKITFNSSTHVETNYDYIYIYDGSGQQIAKYTGTTAANKTLTIIGDTFSVKLTSDSSVVKYGYAFSKIQANMGTIYHPEVIVEGFAPTCTESGLSDGTVCEICGEIIKPQQELVPRHSYTAIVTIPTCTEQGYTTYTCDRCNDTYIDNYMDPSHNYIGGICSNCGNKKQLSNGTCGNNAIYVLYETGELVISGSGDMWDSYSQPWASKKSFIQAVVIDEGISSIGSYAFYSCNNLTSITIPDSVTSIGSYAFYNCNSLTVIAIPDSVQNIGQNSFYNCANLERITIGKGITSIESYAFEGCYKLDSVYISDLAAWCKIECGIWSGNPLYYAGNLYLNGELLTELVIPDGVTKIGKATFNSCTSITSVVIPEGVVSIGGDAFYHCSNLASVSIPSSVKEIGSNAFLGCNNLQSVYISDIGAWCDITFGNDDGNPLSFTDHCYLNGIQLTELVVPEGVTSINDFAFESFIELTSVTIPSSVTNIGWMAFSDCDNLTNIAIPASVTDIGESAFYNCIRLTDVYYCGTADQWSSIQIAEYNDPLLNAILHYHNYGDPVVVMKPTFTTAGQEQKTCSICGDIVTASTNMLVGKVSQWNITLEDDCAVNFHLRVSESIESTTKVRLTIGNDTMTYSVSALEKTDDGYFRLTANISAAQMNDFITVMVMNGREIGCNNTYTAREYCDTILTDPQYSKYHAIVKEMLNYGAMAQMYFDYDTEYLANDGITGVGTTAVPESAEEVIVNDAINNLNLYGTSLLFRDRIAVRYYFTGDVTGCTFTANGNTYIPVEKDGMYYVEIADILPQNIAQQIILNVTDASGNDLTVTYGPMNYIVRMNEKGGTELKNLLKALYNYHLAAKRLSEVTV